jgi:hypothetical protein
VAKLNRLEGCPLLESTMLEMKVSALQSFLHSLHKPDLFLAYAYQPETLQKIFQRAMSSQDIATGKASALESLYRTSGARSTWSHKNKAPCPLKPVCYVLAPNTCSDLQMQAYNQGFAIVKDFVLTGFTSNVPSYLDPPYKRPENQAKVPGCP